MIAPMRTPKLTLSLMVLVVGAAVADLPLAVESAMDRCEPMVMLRHGNMISDWESTTSDMTVVLNRAAMRETRSTDHPCLDHAGHTGPPYDPTAFMLFEHATSFTCLAITDSFEDFRVRRTHTHTHWHYSLMHFYEYETTEGQQRFVQ